jgi:hypothetical protein
LTLNSLIAFSPISLSCTVLHHDGHRSCYRSSGIRLIDIVAPDTNRHNQPYPLWPHLLQIAPKLWRVNHPLCWGWRPPLLLSEQAKDTPTHCDERALMSGLNCNDLGIKAFVLRAHWNSNSSSVSKGDQLRLAPHLIQQSTVRPCNNMNLFRGFLIPLLRVLLSDGFCKSVSAVIFICPMQ